MYILVSRTVDGNVAVSTLTDTGAARSPSRSLSTAEFLGFVRDHEALMPRWVWDDTARWYPQLLAAGIRVQRGHDLRLCHVILRNSELTATSQLARAAPGVWDSASVPDSPAAVSSDTLFDLAFGAKTSASGGIIAQDRGVGDTQPGDVDAYAELISQLDAVASCAEPGRLRLLLAAESAGALIAAEMQFAGLPWRSDIHANLLTAELGPRVAHGVRPVRLEELARQIRAALDDASLNPDSQQDLLRALRRADVAVASTRAWELKKVTHPVVEPLLEYKKLSRLLGANGWHWMDTWIVGGRFHPEYVPGGVVTGRWATRGGGALQLPKQVRGAVVADDGWKLVVADAAQLEPRILAALSADTAMAAAGRGKDLYEGIVTSKVVETRAQAKVAMLGAMYGATTGESGRLLPRLARAYPRALALTETAARSGERGDIVTTRLGRSSPRPDENWRATQAQAYDPAASATDERRARSQARDWGRFTRNFIVQGSAAEWALCWMAEIRKALWDLERPDEKRVIDDTMTGPAPAFDHSPHLVFFLHDEVIVHTPAEFAGEVTRIITEAATTAGRLLFGDFPVDFLLTVATVDSYAEAQ
ncbi:MAG TPA: bifunctional 3'-5' exonuclease/DNA polymerase [Glaciibacter sp.]|nr:bifunctional 3'-5' exonuclease/DNA polymerase [Glaciibacter sp.]